jgi:hypothetical protein
MATSQTSESRVAGKRLYSIAEASAYLGRTVGAMREIIWAGKIPIVRCDRRIYLDVRDIERFIEQNKVVYQS